MKVYDFKGKIRHWKFEYLFILEFHNIENSDVLLIFLCALELVDATIPLQLMEP